VDEFTQERRREQPPEQRLEAMFRIARTKKS
jgi:hypothetical protein